MSKIQEKKEYDNLELMIKERENKVKLLESLLIIPLFGAFICYVIEIINSIPQKGEGIKEFFSNLQTYNTNGVGELWLFILPICLMIAAFALLFALLANYWELKDLKSDKKNNKEINYSLIIWICVIVLVIVGLLLFFKDELFVDVGVYIIQYAILILCFILLIYFVIKAFRSKNN